MTESTTLRVITTKLMSKLLQHTNQVAFFVQESVTISIYKCLWFEGKIKVGNCSLDSRVSFSE